MDKLSCMISKDETRETNPKCNFIFDIIFKKEKQIVSGPVIQIFNCTLVLHNLLTDSFWTNSEFGLKAVASKYASMVKVS